MDGIKTMKFATLYWVGENTKPMTKAKVSTHKGALEACFKVGYQEGKKKRSGFFLLLVVRS